MKGEKITETWYDELNDKESEAVKMKKWYENILNNLFRLFKFLIVCLIAVVVYQQIFGSILTDKGDILAYVIFWFVTAYIFLPWVTRMLTRLYVPEYFIGRTKTSDGLLGDPVNVAFNGEKDAIIQVFQESGWQLADPLTLKTSWKIAYSSVLGKSYPTAPVSPLYLFSTVQDLAFEKEIDGNPRKRHHIRLWRTPEDWYLPGGRQADWLGAATFDKNVGLSLFTGQITHKIDADIDHERDFVIASLKEGSFVIDVEVVPHFTSSYHSRNGGGDRIHTDGALPFVTIKEK